MNSEPTVLRILQGEAESVAVTPYGKVGQLFAGGGVEVVWVAKQAEEIDPGWFSQETVDLIVVVQGKLRFEFECQDFPARVLSARRFYGPPREYSLPAVPVAA